MEVCYQISENPGTYVKSYCQWWFNNLKAIYNNLKSIMSSKIELAIYSEQNL